MRIIEPKQSTKCQNSSLTPTTSPSTSAKKRSNSSVAPPSVLLRFGITAVAGVVVLLLALSYWIKYPDVVIAKVILTTENPPIRMLSKTGGRVSEILIKNNQPVEKGQVLCVMDNTADWRNVLKLENMIRKDNPLSIPVLKQLNLGVLQNAYSTVTQNLKDYHYFLEKNGVLQYANRAA